MQWVKKYPSLWMFLPIPQELRGTFQDHRNTCLNCGERGHFVRTYSEQFLNVHRLTTLGLDLPNDSHVIFCCWEEHARNHQPWGHTRNTTCATRATHAHLGPNIFSTLPDNRVANMITLLSRLRVSRGSPSGHDSGVVSISSWHECRQFTPSAEALLPTTRTLVTFALVPSLHTDHDEWLSMGDRKGFES